MRDTGVEAALSTLVEMADRTQSITALREFPPQPARTVPFPDWIDSRLRRVYERKGISELYTHQARAAERKSLLDAKRLPYRRPDCVSVGNDLPLFRAALEDAPFLFRLSSLF